MSLCVKLFNNSDDLYKSDYWSSKEQPTTVVCPSPAEADRIRLLLSENQQTLNIDVVTISKFISTQFAILEEQPVVSRKADLLLKLSIFWKKIYPNYNYQRFIQAFTLLTELRGTSLELDTMEEILEHYHLEVSNGVRMLWTSMSNLDLYDEHASYSLLAETYRQSPSPFEYSLENRVIFHGFGHLSGVQIDLIKSIAIRQEVIIPYRASLYRNRYQTDWISWISTEEDDQVENVVDEIGLTIPTVKFPKNRMAEALNHFGYKAADIILGATRPILRDYLEIPIEGMYFKTSMDLLSDNFSKFEANIRELFVDNEEQVIETEVVFNKINELRLECIKKTDFRGLKAITLLSDSLHQWKELSIVTDQINIFDWEVIKNCTHLNAPRIYQAPHQGLSKKKGTIYPFSGSVDIRNKRPVFVCINSSHSSFKLAQSEYSQEVASLLSALGPRRRAELDFMKVREDFREMLSRSEPTLFIEEELIEHDLGWAEMFKQMNFKEIKVSENKSPELKDFLNEKNIIASELRLPISPSRLQTYMDCPRKFYFQYIEKVSEKASKKTIIEPKYLGEVEHAVIEKYLIQKMDWDASLHQKVCVNELALILNKNKITLDRSKYISALQEVKSYSRNGIHFLIELAKQLPNPSFKFEQKYQDGDYAGRVDLIVETRIGKGVLDFKRSGASIPEKGQHEKFIKVQLWNYLRHIGKSTQDYLFWGYICLADIEKSLLYSAWDELNSDSFEGLQESIKIHKVESEKIKLSHETYSDLEDDALSKLKSESTWRAQPTHKNACSFCDLSNLCSRGMY